MRMFKMAGVAMGLVLLAGQANALDTIYSPNAEAGEWAIEYSGSRTFDKNVAKDAATEHEVAAEFAVGDRTMVELVGAFENEPDDGGNASHFGIETRFQFFEQGANWIDTGLLLAYNTSLKKNGADAGEVKLLLEKDVGQFTTKANIGFEADIGKNSDANGPEYSFAMNTRYRYAEAFEPGIELQNTLGRGDTVKNFDQQEHYIGPSIQGKLFSHVKYEAAYLLGFSDAASGGAGRVKVEYEMPL
ncbi:MAG: hypothetical protein K2Q32_08530 [Alphaproteobacteria bacterium]|nr:hypothetical protein [Alphaproteobacteria bacterium]